MSTTNQLQYRCSLCGAERPASELNGLDPMTGDNSRAYCRRIAQCRAEEAQAALDWVITELHKAETLPDRSYAK